MSAFNNFSEYLSLMSQISDNLRDFASRTRNIDNVINQIDLTLQENDRLSRFLTSHFEKIETSGFAALKAVDLSDAHFREAIEKLKVETDNCLNQAFRAVNESASHFSGAIEKLKEEIDSRISRLNQDASANESKLAEIYNEIGVKLASATSEHISQLQTAYSNAVPRFDQLNNLQILPKIQEQLSDGISQLQNNTKLIEAINQLNTSLTTKKSRARLRTSQSDFFRKLRNPVLFFRRKRNTE